VPTFDDLFVSAVESSSQAMRVLALENELTSMRGGQEISLLDVCRGLAGERPSDHACLRDKRGSRGKCGASANEWCGSARIRSIDHAP
jgi:hypothetical protein